MGLFVLANGILLIVGAFARAYDSYDSCYSTDDMYPEGSVIAEDVSAVGRCVLLSAGSIRLTEDGTCEYYERAWCAGDVVWTSYITSYCDTDVYPPSSSFTLYVRGQRDSNLSAWTLITLMVVYCCAMLFMCFILRVYCKVRARQRQIRIDAAQNRVDYQTLHATQAFPPPQEQGYPGEHTYSAEGFVWRQEGPSVPPPQGASGTDARGGDDVGDAVDGSGGDGVVNTSMAGFVEPNSLSAFSGGFVTTKALSAGDSASL